jgi:hypothetical protein
MKLGMDNLQCPDYTLLSKRLKQLNLTAPRFRKNEKPDDNIVAIAIDSTGLSGLVWMNGIRKNIRLMLKGAGEKRTLLLMRLTLFKAQYSPIKIRWMISLIGCFALGIIGWQSVRQYGKRNISETAMQRYKKVIGNTLHSREFENQSKEMLLGCSILNRFTKLGMPNSYRVA